MPGVGAFCDATRDAVKGNVFDDRAPGFVSGGDFNAQWLACCVRGWVDTGGTFPVKSPAQTITYLSAHDDLTLWDKLTLTLDPQRDFDALSPRLLRANRLAAAINFCCQGRPFFLLGEEAARTKRGDRNSYRSGTQVNRIDWRRTGDVQALVDYYRGLIALRGQLPALCDKGKGAASRIQNVYTPADGTAVIVLDNRGRRSRYARVLLAVNVREEARRVALPQGEWLALCDGEDAFRWQSPQPVAGEVELPPVSALILGQR